MIRRREDISFVEDIIFPYNDRIFPYMEWSDENPYHRVFDEARRTGNFFGILFFLVYSEKRKSINTVLIFSENIFQQVSGNILPEIVKVTESCTDKVFTKSWLNYLWRREI